MENIKSSADLRAAIVKLESRQLFESKLMKEQFHITYESIKPVNLIKSTFREAGNSVEVKDGILNATVGVGAGYFSKLLFQIIAKSPLNKLLGTALQFSVTNVIAKNPEMVKSLGSGVIKFFMNKRKENALNKLNSDVTRDFY